MKKELLQFSEKSTVSKLFIEFILKDVGIKVKRDVIGNLEFGIDVFQNEVLPEYIKSVNFQDVYPKLKNVEASFEQIQKLKKEFTELVSTF